MASGLFTLKQQAQALRQGAWNGQKTKSVEYLVVAGGGGGGGYYGAGGGGGGLLQGITPVPIGQSITVTVGAGGTGSSNGYGNNGVNSSFGSITAIGGGGGAGGSASSMKIGNSGGSGGGSQTFGVGGTATGGLSLANQGNAGGACSGGVGGAGGGAGTAGLYSLGYVGRGGSGLASAISGNMTAYAGGGGGAGIASSFGGVGGGGNSNVAGVANTGGGGGGDDAKSGGSGIVIISYPDVYPAAASSTNATVSTSGSGSIAFNGSQYFQIANNTALQFGTGSFTVEGWFYITSAPTSNNALFSIGSYNSGILLRHRGAGADLLYINNTAYNWNPSTNFLLNQWNHVAVVRNGSTVTIYVNGTSVFTTTNTSDIAPSTVTTIGSSTHDAGGETCVGYITNFRIVKGTALYTSNFTPSTTPLTAITNTSYLLNAMSGGLLVDSSVNGLVPNSSSALAPTWNSASPFATGLGYKNRVYTWTTSGSITF